MKREGGARGSGRERVGGGRGWGEGEGGGREGVGGTRGWSERKGERRGGGSKKVEDFSTT